MLRTVFRRLWGAVGRRGATGHPGMATLALSPCRALRSHCARSHFRLAGRRPQRCPSREPLGIRHAGPPQSVRWRNSQDRMNKHLFPKHHARRSTLGMRYRCIAPLIHAMQRGHRDQVVTIRLSTAALQSVADLCGHRDTRLAHERGERRQRSAAQHRLGRRIEPSRAGAAHHRHADHAAGRLDGEADQHVAFLTSAVRFLGIDSVRS